VAAAVLTWLVAMPLLSQLPRYVNLNPFTGRGATFPVAVALVLATVLLGVALVVVGRPRLEGPFAGVCAGLLAAWVALTLRAALYGTPFGYVGLGKDMARMSAMANRYSTTIQSADPWIPNLPAEYPPLYPWLIGRAAALLDLPAWRLVGKAEVVTMSAAVLVAFVLWQRLVGVWPALVIPALSMLTWGQPDKAFEIISLLVFTPWVLDVLAHPPRRRLHWLVSGVIGGLIVLTYQGWLIFAALGIAAMIVSGWRAAPDRRAYVRHLLAVMAVAAVVASWFVVPYVVTALRSGTQVVADLYQPPEGLLADLFPFLAPTPLALFQLVGLVGLVALRRSTWWAQPILLLVASAVVFRVVFTMRYVLTGHTTAIQYTPRMYGVLLTAAGVLTAAVWLPAVLTRLGATTGRRVLAAAVAIALGWAAFGLAQVWMPRGGATPNDAARAHLEPLPGGGYPRYAPADARTWWFPSGPVIRAVERAIGPVGDRVTLSTNERLYSYAAWSGYMGRGSGSANSLARWHDRRAEIVRLAGIGNADALADAAGRTRFGPIDVLILYRQPDGWYFSDIRFAPEQFRSPRWSVIDLPQRVVAVIRRPP